MTGRRVRIEKRTGLHFNCDRCGKPIEKPGALLFSPPQSDLVKKHHICTECYDQIVRGFRA